MGRPATLFPESGSPGIDESPGTKAKLEGLQGVALSEMDVDACLDLQRVNLGDAADGWDEEAARAALRHEESRVILMRGPTPAAEEAGEGGVEGTGGGDEFDAADEWDFVPEWQPSKMPGIFDVSRVKEEDEGEAAQTEAVDVSDGPEAEVPPLLAYLHLQFCLESGKPPLLCVLNVCSPPPQHTPPAHMYPLRTGRQGETRVSSFFIR